ncbi:hypothetical protein ACQRDX_01370 [Streptococcus sp. SGI.013]|uniref:hypothetical protein n=1 Tax=unclassified Streptococcus TaxID=2608887 RepID=UPI003D0907E8
MIDAVSLFSEVREMYQRYQEGKVAKELYEKQILWFKRQIFLNCLEDIEAYVKENEELMYLYASYQDSLDWDMIERDPYLFKFLPYFFIKEYLDFLAYEDPYEVAEPVMNFLNRTFENFGQVVDKASETLGSSDIIDYYDKMIVKIHEWKMYYRDYCTGRAVADDTMTYKTGYFATYIEDLHEEVTETSQ